MAHRSTVCVITLTYNEEAILPFFLDHYSFADKIIVYDGCSSDRTCEILKSNHRVDLRVMDTGGKLCDSEHLRVKNEAHKSEQHDWFIVCDCDEFLYHQVGVEAFIYSCDQSGITMPDTYGYGMVGGEVRAGFGPITSQQRYGVRDKWYDKRALFRRGISPGFHPGAHQCSPCGRVVHGNPPCGPIKLLHYNFISLEHALRKRLCAKDRLSDENKLHGWGCHPDQNIENVVRSYFRNLSRCEVVVSLSEKKHV